MGDFPDTRSCLRLDCQVPVDSRESSPLPEVKTFDISRNGIGLISSRPVPLNERIAIELVLEPGTEPVLVIGQVRWVHRVGRHGQYRIGVAFSDILEGSKDRLDRAFPDHAPDRKGGLYGQD